MDSIAENVSRVRERIARALERAGRREGDVTLVAITKTFGAETVAEVIAAGVLDIGENRIQEFLSKAPVISGECRWHLVGPLQRNKATKAVGRFHLVHALDGVRIAQTLDRLGRERGLTTSALLEINTSGEPSKHGIAPESAAEVAAEIAGMAAVDLRGLMTMGPTSMDADRTRECFRDLFEIRERLQSELGHALPELSMGMSGDFEIAIEEGATIVRVGRGITGERGG